MVNYGRNIIGKGTTIFEPVVLGFPSQERIGETDYPGTVIGKGSVIRSGTVIYCDVAIGDNLQCGHNILIREKTTIGHHATIGHSVVIDGNCEIGDYVRFQALAGICPYSTIGNEVFIGPNAIFTNNRFPPDKRIEQGPLINDKAVIGAGSIILPAVEVGAGSVVAAGSIVTRDVPPGMLAIGSPARFRELPDELQK